MDVNHPDFQTMYWLSSTHSAYVERAQIQAKRVYLNQPVYERVTKDTKIDARIVGALHAMEADCDLRRRLEDGTELNNGEDWVEEAIKTINFDIKKFKFPPSNLTEYLLFIEAHNGRGYRGKIFSPYLFSGTQFYTKGKYDRDGHYDPELVSKQVGAIPILKMLGVLYPDQKLGFGTLDSMTAFEL